MLTLKIPCKEKQLKKNRVHKGRSVDFYNDKILLPNKKVAYREYLSHPGAVALLAFVNPQHIVLVKQYRYPVAQVTLEVPAGKLAAREDPKECVMREMREETGYIPKKITKMLSYWPTPAFSDEVLHIYVTKHLVPSTMNPDHDEFLEPVIMSYQKALQLVRRGIIRDSKTVIALTAYQAFHK